jgi:hypothetical protein
MRAELHFRDIEVAGGVGAEFQAVEGLAEIPWIFQGLFK